MINAIFYTVAFLAIQFLTALAFLGVNRYMGNGDTTLTTDMQMLSMVASSVLTLIVFCLLRWSRPTRAYIQSRPWGVLFWSVVASLGAIIPSVWLQEHMPELPNIVEQEISAMMMHRGGYFVICILAPVAEELVMRGAVLRSLLEWKPQARWAMIAVSALLFALIHMNPAQMPHAFAIGLLLGWMYERTGSLTPGIAFHWANNTAAYLMFRMYPAPSLRLIDIFSGQQSAVAAAVMFSLFILLPALFQLNLRMRKTSKQPFSRMK